MKKNIAILAALLLSKVVFSQLYFHENFEFESYEDFKEIGELKNRWTFFHSENQDFNNNRITDNWENIKSIELVEYEEGNKALKFHLKKMDRKILEDDVMKNGKIEGEKVEYQNFFTHIARNEIATWDDPYLTAYRPNKNYEFQFDVMVPEDFEFEKHNCANPSKANFELTGQWHFSHLVMNGKTMSPISLRIVCDTWILNINPNNQTEEQDVDFIPLSKIEKGKWVTWKFQLRFSHKKKGYFYVWKDDRLVFSKQNEKTIFGKRTLDGIKSTVYFKIGVYKPHWWSRESDVTERKIYFDNVKVTN